MGINSLKLLVVLLLTAAFMVSAHAIPATDPNVDTPTKVHDLVTRAAPPDRFPTNPVVATGDVAYTSCCEFLTLDDGSLNFILNLAGWGNTNQKKNHTISDDESCAAELSREVYNLGEVMLDWVCVPSYGALRDTFVSFNYPNPHPNNVIVALQSVDPKNEKWTCWNITMKPNEVDPWICRPQQLNI
ncbi:hypothetical protein EAE96_005013 [Botrytis aclada]|nr:hypothetical protein EAE96_005013 [Botrytis aclada]